MEFLITGSEKLKRSAGFKLVGRAEELREISYILMRSKADSIHLVGAGGVGLSTLLLGLQAAKERDDAPFDLVAKRLYWLDVDKLFGMSEEKDIRTSFYQMMAIMDKTPESVLIIENSKSFIEGAKACGNGFLNSLTTAVRGGKTQIIWETRDEDMEYVMKAYPDLHEFYTLLDVKEPAGDDLLQIALHATERLSQHHKILHNTAAVEAAVKLTSKYRTAEGGLSRAQPERTITLLDRAFASYRLSAHAGKTTEKMRRLHTEVREAEEFINETDEEIARLEKELKEIPSGEKPSFAARVGSDTPEIAKLRKRRDEVERLLAQSRAEFDELIEDVNSSLLLRADLVMAEFSKVSGIPASKLNEDEREKLKNMEGDLNKVVFGQAAAVKAVSNAAKVARIGRRGEGPLAVFMLGGPSGVGKTELVKRFAAHQNMVLDRIDMSEFMEKHAVAKLIGAPPGYEGFAEGGRLTNSVRRNPSQVFLFDEIDKAHGSVFDILLQVLDAGRLTDNIGRVVSFSESYVFLTTNIGQPYLLNADLPFEEAVELAKKVLGEFFRSEFLNRINGRENILWFERLAQDSIVRIVQREIAQIERSYEGIGLRVDLGAEAAFVRDHYDVKTGARGLPGYLRANLDPIIADIVLAGHKDGILQIGYDEKAKAFTTSFDEFAPSKRLKETV